VVALAGPYVGGGPAVNPSERLPSCRPGTASGPGQPRAPEPRGQLNNTSTPGAVPRSVQGRRAGTRGRELAEGSPPGHWGT